MADKSRGRRKINGAQERQEMEEVVRSEEKGTVESGMSRIV